MAGPRASGLRTLIPDHAGAAALHGARERGACRAGALRVELPLLASRRPVKRRSTGRRQMRSTVVELAARARHARRRAVARREAPARDRHRAGPGAQAPPARRADGGRRHRGDAAAWSTTLKGLKRPLHHRSRRARHAGGVCARRPHLRAGRGPHHRHRRHRRPCAPIRPCAPPTLARRHELRRCFPSRGCRPGYGDQQVLFGVDLDRRRGRGGRA